MTDAPTMIGQQAICSSVLCSHQETLTPDRVQEMIAHQRCLCPECASPMVLADRAMLMAKDARR